MKAVPRLPSFAGNTALVKVRIINASVVKRQEAVSNFIVCLKQEDVQGFLFTACCNKENVATHFTKLIAVMLAVDVNRRLHSISVFTRVMQMARLLNYVKDPLDPKEEWPWSFVGLRVATFDFPTVSIMYPRPCIKVREKTNRSNVEMRFTSLHTS